MMLRRKWRDKGSEKSYQTWKTNKGDPTNAYLVFPKENGMNKDKIKEGRNYFPENKKQSEKSVSSELCKLNFRKKGQKIINTVNPSEITELQKIKMNLRRLSGRKIK